MRSQHGFCVPTLLRRMPMARAVYDDKPDVLCSSVNDMLNPDQKGYLQGPFCTCLPAQATKRFASPSAVTVQRGSFQLCHSLRPSPAVAWCRVTQIVALYRERLPLSRILLVRRC